MQTLKNRNEVETPPQKSKPLRTTATTAMTIPFMQLKNPCSYLRSVFVPFRSHDRCLSLHGDVSRRQEIVELSFWTPSHLPFLILYMKHDINRIDICDRGQRVLFPPRKRRKPSLKLRQRQRGVERRSIGTPFAIHLERFLEADRVGKRNKKAKVFYLVCGIYSRRSLVMPLTVFFGLAIASVEIFFGDQEALLRTTLRRKLPYCIEIYCISSAKFIVKRTGLWRRHLRECCINAFMLHGGEYRVFDFSGVPFRFSSLCKENFEYSMMEIFRIVSHQSSRKPVWLFHCLTVEKISPFVFERKGGRESVVNLFSLVSSQSSRLSLSLSLYIPPPLS